MPLYITERVFSAVHDLGERCTVQDGENLIAKVQLLCDGVDSELVPGVDGTLSVTKILDKLKEDAKTGGHPQLRTRHI